jgi:uncharacterized protein (AIM24 family)
MPMLEVVLEPNEAIISEAGELSWLGAPIQMTTHTQIAGGGFFGANTSAFSRRSGNTGISGGDTSE